MIEAEYRDALQERLHRYNRALEAEVPEDYERHFTELVESESSPARKYHQLTQKGKECQQAMLREWEQLKAAVNHLAR